MFYVIRKSAIFETQLTYTDVKEFYVKKQSLYKMSELLLYYHDFCEL